MSAPKAIKLARVLVPIPPEDTPKGWDRVKLVMVVVASVEVPVTERVPLKEGELATLMVPEEVEVETVMLVPARML